MGEIDEEGGELFDVAARAMLEVLACFVQSNLCCRGTLQTQIYIFFEFSMSCVCWLVRTSSSGDKERKRYRAGHTGVMGD